jgi:hypothetical protein
MEDEKRIENEAVCTLQTKPQVRVLTLYHKGALNHPRHKVYPQIEIASRKFNNFHTPFFLISNCISTL